MDALQNLNYFMKLDFKFITVYLYNISNRMLEWNSAQIGLAKTHLENEYIFIYYDGEYLKIYHANSE